MPARAPTPARAAVEQLGRGRSADRIRVVSPCCWCCWLSPMRAIACSPFCWGSVWAATRVVGRLWLSKRFQRSCSPIDRGVQPRGVRLRSPGVVTEAVTAVGGCDPAPTVRWTLKITGSKALDGRFPNSSPRLSITSLATDGLHQLLLHQQGMACSPSFRLRRRWRRR